MMSWLVSISLRHRVVVVTLAIVMMFAAWRTLRTMPLDVFPEFAPPLVEIQTEAPGLSTSDVEALVTIPLEAALTGVPDVRTIRSKSVLGLSSVVLTGASATIVVRLYGPDLDGLQSQAQALSTAIGGVSGVTDLKVQAQVLVPQIEVRFRPERAAVFGLTSGEVRRPAATLIQGTKVGEFYEEQRVFDVVVWGVEDARRNLDAIRALRVSTPGGGDVPLTAVADVQITPVPNEITRENGSRRIDVTCNVSGRDLGAVARDVEARVAGVTFERGYYAEVLGEYAARQASTNRLLLLGSVALAGIFLVLLVDFGSARLAGLVFFTLPFALVGAIVATMLTGGVLSLGSLVGLVTVIGIAARNGIMLVSHYRHLETEEGMAFGRALVLRGTEERLAPILMTALATGLALVPIVLGGTRAGYEIEHPLAVVILGGLVTSTVLNLFVVPALYLRFGRLAPASEP